MRTLSTVEKKICKRLLSLERETIVIGNLLDFPEIPLSLECDFEMNAVLLFSPDDHNLSFETFGHAYDLTQRYTREVITTVNLLILLEKEGYIQTFDGGQPPKFKLVTRPKPLSDIPIFSYPFPDQDFEKLILKYFLKHVGLTQAFRDFLAENFVSTDEIRFRKTQSSANWALIVSILSFLLSLIVAIKQL